jgi:putative ABC transport system permease protein
MMIMSRSLIRSLESTRHEYYEAYRFADVFVHLKRAPNSLVDRVSAIPGVAAVQARHLRPGHPRPARTGRTRQRPGPFPARHEPPALNRLFLRARRWLRPGAMAKSWWAKPLPTPTTQPGDPDAAVERTTQTLRIAGIVLSPEFIFESRPGTALPDNRTYGIFWMPYRALASAYDLYGAFNQLALTLAPGASERPVLGALDEPAQTLRRARRPRTRRSSLAYPRLGRNPRAPHPGDRISLVFLSVAAFMTNAVLSRLLTLQREQIAILKAFGFANRQIVCTTSSSPSSWSSPAPSSASSAASSRDAHRRPVPTCSSASRNWPSASIAGPCCRPGRERAGRHPGRLQQRPPRRPAPARRSHAPRTAGPYRPALIERTGMARVCPTRSGSRCATSNANRFRPCFTIAGLALATGILIVPNCFRDGIQNVLDFQWDVVQRQDIGIGLVEPSSDQVKHLFAHLPGVIAVEPFRSAAVRLRFGARHRQLGIQGLPAHGRHSRVIDANYRQITLPAEGVWSSRRNWPRCSARASATS